MILESHEDDLRLNRRLPSIGQTLSITGIDFNVEVTGLTSSTSVVDGNDEPVTTIFFKGTSREKTGLSPFNYITSLEDFVIDEEAEDECEGEDEDEEEEDDDDEGEDKDNYENEGSTLAEVDFWYCQKMILQSVKAFGDISKAMDGLTER